MSRGIGCRTNRTTGWVEVEYGNPRSYAAFHIHAGGFPFGGEFVTWNEHANPISMLVGESSGTHLVDAAKLNVSKAEVEGMVR